MCNIEHQIQVSHLDMNTLFNFIRSELLFVYDEKIYGKVSFCIIGKKYR